MNQVSVEPLLDVFDLMEWLQVDLDLVSEWIATDFVPYLDFEGIIRFEPGEIRRWLREHQIGCGAQSSTGAASRREAEEQQQFEAAAQLGAAGLVLGKGR